MRTVWGWTAEASTSLIVLKRFCRVHEREVILPFQAASQRAPAQRMRLSLAFASPGNPSDSLLDLEPLDAYCEGAHQKPKADARTRTENLPLTRRELYQLSYVGLPRQDVRYAVAEKSRSARKARGAGGDARLRRPCSGEAAAEDLGAVRRRAPCPQPLRPMRFQPLPLRRREVVAHASIPGLATIFDNPPTVTVELRTVDPHLHQGVPA